MAIADVPADACVVLLGEPGSGKTAVMEALAARNGGGYVTARGFIVGEANEGPPDRALYVDALDEALAAGRNTPSDDVAARLHGLGRPRFWLSCRPMDYAAMAGTALFQGCSAGREFLVLALLPLDQGQVEAVVRELGADPHHFLSAVGRVGLEGLLDNPQSLRMLVAVYLSPDGLPSSRLELYRHSVSVLASETGKNRPRPRHDIPPERILRAAGRACTVMLLSDRPAFDPRAAVNVPGGDRLAGGLLSDEREALDAAVATRLFVARGDGAWVPQHRTIAEFLAADFLAAAVAQGLPLARVHALLARDDREPPPSLRGLHAWFGTLCHPAADRCITRDPVGMLAYGDPSAFQGPRLRTLVDALREAHSKDPYFLRGEWGRARLTVLADPVLADDVAAVLRERPWQGQFANSLLAGLASGRACSGLVPVLADLLVDDCVPADVRPDVAAVLLATGDAGSSAAARAFHRILADPTLDPCGDAAARLLTGLYPAVLGLPDVLALADVWVTRLQPGINARVRIGWELASLVPTGQEAAVLDSLAGRSWVPGRYDPPTSGSECFGNLAGALLARALPEVGPSGADRLARWLRLIRAGTRGQDKHRPDLLMAARADLFVPLALAATETAQSDFALRPHLGWMNLDDLIQRNLRPPDAVERLLAATVDEQVPGRAALLATMAIQLATETGRDISDAVWSLASTRAAIDFHTRYWFGHSSLDEEGAKLRRSMKEEARALRAEKQRRNADTRAHLEAVLDEIRAGTATNAILFLTNVWHGLLLDDVDRELSPPDRLASVGSHAVAEAAMAGWRALVTLHPLPTPAEVGQVEADSRRMEFIDVYLLGADLLESDQPGTLRVLDTQRRRTLIVLGFIGGPGPRGNQDESPSWLPDLVEADPALAVGAMLDFIAPQLLSPTWGANLVHRMATHTAVKGVRHELFTEMLRMPMDPATVLPLVEAVLRDDAGLGEAKRGPDSPRAGEILRVAQVRLDGSTDDGDRWPWLHVAWRLNPIAHEYEVEQAAKCSLERLEDIAKAAGLERWVVSGLHLPLALGHNLLLARLCGRVWPPAKRGEGAQWGTSEADRSDFVFARFDGIAAEGTREASVILRGLLADPMMSTHAEALTHAIARCERERERRSWEVPGAERVVAALRDGPPATGGDLLAFAVDHLETIGSRLRTTEDEDWQKFWNTDQHGRAADRRVENVCRNEVASLLRVGFQARGVMLGVEVAHAGQTRCDIRATGLPHLLPIEVKRQDHPDLWTAWRTQLAEGYSSEPAAGGRGIYLVIWFGEGVVPPHPAGLAVEGAATVRGALAQLVREAELSASIRIVVLDATPPPGRRKPSVPRTAVNKKPGRAGGGSVQLRKTAKGRKEAGTD